MTVDAETIRLPRNARTFTLKVRGDAMVHAGILDGDLVIMEFREARSGDIVVALIDGEALLKRYVKRNGIPYLRTERPGQAEEVPVGELVVQGVLVALVRLPS